MLYSTKDSLTGEQFEEAHRMPTHGRDAEADINALRSDHLLASDEGDLEALIPELVDINPHLGLRLANHGDDGGEFLLYEGTSRLSSLACFR
jgi:hypothetical protein